MNHFDDTVKPCRTMGHAYSTVLLLRCPHRESYTARATTWVDDPSGEPHVLFEEIEEFGPFDDHSYIRARVGYLAANAAAFLQEHELV